MMIGGALEIGHRSPMETRSASLNIANPAAALVDPIYAEALKLADAARGYFDGPGIAEREQLPDAARTATAVESLRITTRLIAIVSWGLLQQAIRNGEVAAQADRRLTTPDADVALELLPARAPGLAVASRDLFARAHAADSALAA
jgi:regulator of CtrA degradation